VSLHRLFVVLRRVFRLTRLAVLLVAGLALARFVVPHASALTRARITGAWSRQLLAALGVRLAASRVPQTAHGALLVANHVSWLDIYVVFATRHVHFVSKSEVRRWPLVGWLAASVGTLFLERGRRADTARVNAAMHTLIDAGEWVAVFPEGTTSDGRGLRRFLPSLLQPALDLACPVVPAAIRYQTASGDHAAAAAYIDDTSLWQSVKRIADAGGLVARLDFAEPLAATGHRRELALSAEHAVADLMGLPRTAAGRSATQPD
jgi:1-acyl-sn-glycerol-3-phosphate acyltransferase